MGSTELSTSFGVSEKMSVLPNQESQVWSRPSTGLQTKKEEAPGQISMLNPRTRSRGTIEINGARCEIDSTKTSAKEYAPRDTVTKQSKSGERAELASTSLRA